VPDEPVNFDRITKLYREESQKKGLSLLEPDFWDKVNRYIARLEADLAVARAKDPNGKSALLYQDELRKVQQKREQIYAYRERKIALLASQRAGGASVEIRGLAKPEQELLDRLVELLRTARVAALNPSLLPTAAPPTALASVAAPPPPPKPESAPAGVLVHVLEDVPPFAGPDGTYRLKKEDIVVVHPSIAKVLTERGKARVVSAMP
jgi:DNA replication initiation complex subunit (GINS family)